MKLQDGVARELPVELGMLSLQADFFFRQVETTTARPALGGGRVPPEFRTQPQPMGPRGRLAGLLIGEAAGEGARGSGGTAEVRGGSGRERAGLRGPCVSSCGGRGSIQRRRPQLQPVALLLAAPS